MTERSLPPVQPPGAALAAVRSPHDRPRRVAAPGGWNAGAIMPEASNRVAPGMLGACAGDTSED